MRSPLSLELLVADFYSPLTGTVVVTAVVLRGQQSRANTVGISGRIRNRVGTLSRQTFNDLSTSLSSYTMVIITHCLSPVSPLTFHTPRKADISKIRVKKASG